MKYFFALIALLIFPFTFLSAENPRTMRKYKLSIYCLILIIFLIQCKKNDEEKSGSNDPYFYTDVTSYFPSWHNATPKKIINLDFDSTKTSEENGAILAAKINSLVAGDKLVIGSGTWTINMYYNVNIQGTSTDPIWIVAKEDTRPVITRPDENQNVINFGQGSARVAYVCFRGMEVTGGSLIIRLENCSNMWIDQCYIHHGNGVGIAANSADTDRLYITRNEISYPATTETGEGMYLGANYGTYKMSNSIIALNHVHHCGGSQGDGIELKQGSYNNWIVENHVHDTNYPCILVYGTGGQPRNIIERNIMYNSNDNTMQVQGEAIVRNNLIMNATANAFYSGYHQGDPINLMVVHNTIIDKENAVYLRSWGNKSNDMVFANNAVYSLNSAIYIDGTLTNITLAGNVFYGTAYYYSTNISSYGLIGNGLSDFVNISWDANNRDATPSSGSPLIGTADSDYAVTDDITGRARISPLDIGAYDYR